MVCFTVGGLIAFIFGIAEALMLKSALSSFTSGNYTKAVALVLIKLFLYGAASALLVFAKLLYACLIGYAAGLPLAVVGWFIYYTVRTQRVKSGDDKNESNNNN